MLKTSVCLLLLAVYVTGELTQSAYLDVQEKFYIEWQYTDHNITILAKVKTTGWFGIGFSPNGGMAGADIITASVVNGTAQLQDRYAERNGYPQMDQSQDVQLLSGSEVDGVTTVEFTRKHNTCDDKDMRVGTDTMRIIYAISPDGSDNLAYHTPFNRGTRSIYLRREFTTLKSLPNDSISIDLVVDKLAVSSAHTQYYCTLMRAPKLDKKHHLIKVEPLIQKENLGLVHHVVLYGCYDNIDREHHFTNGTTGMDCTNQANMPPDLIGCKTAVFAWGIGAGPTYYPEEAGFPLGGDDSMKYIIMEMHYDNPKLLSGIIDSSGFRMTLTPTLRQYDAGILGIGAVNGIAIPPKVKDFTSSGFCTTMCTQDNIKEDLNIFGSFLHGHLTTTQIIARHFRDGKELDIIDEDRHYDFNYQQAKMLENPVILKSGDSILVQCHHNTMDRANVTYGGLPSKDEMCVGFMYYYPAGPLDYCYSIAGHAAVGPQDTTKIRNFVKNVLDYPGNVSTYYKKAFNQINQADGWTKKRSQLLQDSYLDLPHAELCLKRDFASDPPWTRPQRWFTPPTASKNPPALRDYEKECSKPTNQPDSVIG